MLLWKARTLCSVSLKLPPIRTVYTTPQIIPSNLTVQALEAINACESRGAKIEGAVNRNLYALATIIATKSPPAKLSLKLQQQVVRGLTQYHPRLMAVNFNALTRFLKIFETEIDSVDKAALIDALIRYDDQPLIRSSLSLLNKSLGGPLPVSSIMNLVAYAKSRHAIEVCVSLWYYMRDNFPLSMREISVVMVDLMETFARSKRHRELAEEAARYCMSNYQNPSIALSIAKVSYMLNNNGLMETLLQQPGFTTNREISGVIAQLKAKEGTKAEDAVLDLDPTAQEQSGVVKAVAARDLLEAEDFAKAHMLDEYSNDNQRPVLSLIALCNQYIHENDFRKFRQTLKSLYELKAVSGLLLNLKLTWELHHGNFQHAKRHYQNFRDVPLKQRYIALQILGQMATDDSEKEWTAVQNRTLESLKTFRK